MLPVTVSACNSSSGTMCKMYHNTDNWQEFREGYLKSRGVSKISVSDFIYPGGGGEGVPENRISDFVCPRGEAGF